MGGGGRPVVLDLVGLCWEESDSRVRVGVQLASCQLRRGGVTFDNHHYAIDGSVGTRTRVLKTK